VTIVEGKAAELRRAFDLAFAEPHHTGSEQLEDLLSIRVGGDPYAIRLMDLAAIVSRRPIVPLPAAASALLGLAGIHGAVVPVFDLAALLEHAPSAEAPRWMALVGKEEPIALAFADLEAYLRLPRSAIHAEASAGKTKRYVSQVARTEADARFVIDVPSLVATIRDGVERGREKER
jgi:chemotaxis signal transduction protein